MTTKKYSIFSTMCIATLFLVLIYTFCMNSTQAYADEITEATVTTDSTQSDTSNVPTSTQAPVSIAVYSDVVTESSDTYDYTNKQTVTLPSVDTSIAVTPQVPDGSSEVITTAPMGTPSPDDVQVPVVTRDPQSTAAPDAPPEPDIISYPPTVAPAYQD